VIDISTDPYSRRSSFSQGEKLGDLLFSSPVDSYQYTSRDFKRGTLDCNHSYSQLSDIHTKYRAKIVYLRLRSDGEPKTTTIASAGKVTRVAQNNDSGSLLGVIHNGVHYTVWLPFSGGRFRIDERGRIEVSPGSGVSSEWLLYPRVGVTISHDCEPGEMIGFPYVVLEDPEGELFRELSFLSDIETRLYRKSDWFFALAPKDLWNYLINGSLYDPRCQKGIDKRFKCQQCAFSWWSYFDFLGRKTRKKIYSLLRDEVAYSVLLDLSSQGEWGHGYWSDEIETHARFHLDGIHLLLSQYESTGASIWLEAAERGLAFVFDHLIDTLDDGCPWFLHDTLEGKKYRLKSNLFGKSVGNSLCINTHVQALTVLYRLSRLTEGKPIYADRLERGAASLRRVLDYQPGEPFYRFLAFMLTRCFQGLGQTDALWKRIHRGVYWRATLMIYWWLKRLFPRLVLPQGFIERDLTHSVGADHYHNTNLKDLLTLYQQVPYPWLRPYIENGFAFERHLIRTWGLGAAVARSPYYFEFIDILDLYGRLVAPLPEEELTLAERALYNATGGCSLDYYASELVRPRNLH
jgi:hypothetical protein